MTVALSAVFDEKVRLPGLKSSDSVIFCNLSAERQYFICIFYLTFYRMIVLNIGIIYTDNRQAIIDFVELIWYNKHIKCVFVFLMTFAFYLDSFSNKTLKQ